MPTALPFVAAAYAAFFGLMSTVLTARVIMNRVRSGIQAGDGGDASLARAIRAHANFAEQVPLALPTRPRQVGAALTLLVIVAASVLISYRVAALHARRGGR